MALQFPAQPRNQLNLPAIDQAVQRNENNALVNDAQQMQNESTQRGMDRDQATEAGKFMLGLGKLGQESLQQDPESRGALHPAEPLPQGQLHLPVLFAAGVGRPHEHRSRPAALEGWADQLGELRAGVREVQCPQGRPLPQGVRAAAAHQAAASAVDAVHEPRRGGPPGVVAPVYSGE